MEHLLKEYRDEERCKKCGGKCCKIYISVEDNEVYNDLGCYWEEWVLDFHENRKNYSVKPLYDAIDLHLKTLGHESVETYNNAVNELKSKGINPEYCEYLGENGCIIPWDKRSIICKNFICEDWEKDILKVANF